MKYLPLILILPLFVNAQVSKKIDPEKFRSIPVELKLIPNINLFEMQYDVVRQQATVLGADSSSNSTNSDYHILGFDLGNYLFIDLNQNILFRIDQLLGIGENEPFLIEQFQRIGGRKQKRLYRFEEGKFSTTLIRKHRFYEEFNVEHVGGLVNISHKNRYLKTIEKNESGIFLKRKNRVIDGIYFREVANFNTKINPIRGNKFFIDSIGVHINKTILIKTSSDNGRIDIFQKSLFHQKLLLYSIKFNENEIIVYNRKNRGYHLIFSPDKVEIFRNKKLIECYTRLK